MFWFDAGQTAQKRAVMHGAGDLAGQLVALGAVVVGLQLSFGAHGSSPSWTTFIAAIMFRCRRGAHRTTGLH
ncbi:protein of unknown function [Hyphomicrobium sp. 1Nfss2.1]